MTIKGPIPPHIVKLMAPEPSKAKPPVEVFSQEAAKQAALREKEIHEHIAGWLGTQGIVFGHARMDRKSTYTEGWPDFTFAVRSMEKKIAVPVAIEVKAPGEKPTPEQSRVIESLRLNGWVVWVVYSLQEVVTIVKHIQWNPMP